ncbi:MAG: pyridoxamine 5'-phosphate oxidase family protein [Acidimicrobiales bacterium]
MSIPVEIAEVEERIAEYGAQAFLVTVTDDSAPHVVSVVVAVEADRLAMGAGNRTRANLERSPTATVLWPPPSGGAYSLIVDATHDPEASDDEAIALRVVSAVLHRMAGAPGEGPSCLPVTPT